MRLLLIVSLFSASVAFVAFNLLDSSGAAAASESSTQLVLNREVPRATGVTDSVLLRKIQDQFQEQRSGSLIQLARGQECPTRSGQYCSDQAPVCCLIRGTWSCRRQLSDCRE